jgi:hypothetical protein
MPEPTQSTDEGEKSYYASLSVRPEFRDKIRMAKAEEGLSYEEYLRQHLPIEADA